MKFDFVNKLPLVRNLTPAQRKIVIASTIVLTLAGLSTATYFLISNQIKKNKEKKNKENLTTKSL